MAEHNQKKIPLIASPCRTKLRVLCVAISNHKVEIEHWKKKQLWPELAWKEIERAIQRLFHQTFEKRSLATGNYSIPCEFQSIEIKQNLHMNWNNQRQ